VCVGSPGKQYTGPTFTAPPQTRTVPAPVPTNIGPNVTTVCGEYHLTIKDEYCNKLMMQFGISLSVRHEMVLFSWAAAHLR
jgi:hypothetical protein